MGISRKDLMKHAGELVKVEFSGHTEQENFAIGWFFALIDGVLRLKVTSTKYESYESITIESDKVTQIDKVELS